MKSISTLVKDIQQRLVSAEPFNAPDVDAFSHNLAKKLANRLSEKRGTPTLRLSNLGSKCARKLWYSINRPDAAEPLPPSARLKFLFGDILEEVLLFLAKAAGHTVEREQEEVKLHGVTGHIDGVVDGELVDVKSASTYGFAKFNTHSLSRETDDFGYLTQLDGYLSSSINSDLAVPDRAHFLAVDKTLGHITLDTHPKTDTDYEKVVEERKAMLAFPQPPARAYNDEAEGASGNRKLGLACSYCDFKTTCWPGLRKFAYSRKPVFLTVVSKQPNVQELNPFKGEE